MYDKTSGYKNEYDFVLYLNNKKIKDLDYNGRRMILKIYHKIDEESIIKCFRNHYDQKGDIIISINGIIKSVSIKMGSKNSVHTENIHYFIEFLKSQNIPYEVISNYLDFHYADGTHSGKGDYRLSTEEYKINNQDKIDLINKYFSNRDFVLKCLDKFLFIGNNSEYSVSGIICGTPNDYIFLSRSEIICLMLKNIDKYSTGVHVSLLSIQPLARDLNFTGKFEDSRHKVQVKWFNIFDDFMTNEIKKVLN